MVEVGPSRVSQSHPRVCLMRNLFDASYPLSPDPRAVLAPGISVLFTTVLKF